MGITFGGPIGLVAGAVIGGAGGVVRDNTGKVRATTPPFEPRAVASHDPRDAPRPSCSTGKTFPRKKEHGG